MIVAELWVEIEIQLRGLNSKAVLWTVLPGISASCKSQIRRGRQVEQIEFTMSSAVGKEKPTVPCVS